MGKNGKLTNDEFAERVGIHFTMASKLRNGTRKPSVETIIAIRDAFGLNADELLDAYAAGPEEPPYQLGHYLRANVFHEEEAV